MNYSKLKLLRCFAFAFVTMFASLILSCKSKEDPAPVPNLPPLAFNVTSSLSTNGQDVILRWNKSKDPEGDAVTYAVVYKDTLVKNLSDTTYTIKNLPFETEIKGTVVAKDTKGNKTVSSFTMQTGMDYVAIPDVNFEKILIKLKIDNNQDGQVLRKNVVGITYLELSNNNGINADKIKNLTGIEAFTNLEDLNGFNNLLTSVDISKNNNLKTLYLNGNQLTSLDISKNSGLLLLGCNDNNLTNLDVSKNLMLASISCYSNKLTSLDISKNLTLLKIYCNNNQLTSLDISKNTSLKVLSCFDNKLTNITIDKNLALIELYCNGNPLNILDISKNIALSVLYCNNNQLSTFDVSKNVALFFLNCADNKLTNLDIRKNILMTGFDSRNNQIQTICVNNLNQVTKDWQKDPTATYKVCP